MSSALTSYYFDSEAVRAWESEGGGLAGLVPPLPVAGLKNRSSKYNPGHFTKLRNDNGIAQIRIGMKEFECIGVTPPHDHPHVHLNMGLAKAMLCPYCSTSFHYDTSLIPDGVIPIDSRYS